MQASKEKLYQHVEFLTELNPARSFDNLESINRAADYIRDKFAETGTTPSEQTWIASGNEYRNIILSYLPEKGKRLIVGAHYDVAGDQPGADDNASAVAGLLESARMIFAEKPDLDYGIDFVAYSLEEPPFFATEKMGSYVHAKSLHDKNTDVLGMVCYVMIGYFSDEPGSQNFPDPALSAMYSDVGNYIVVVGIVAHSNFTKQIYHLMDDVTLPGEIAVDVEHINFPERGSLASMSDHDNYWHFGYPSVMITDTAFVRNPNYHLKSDTIDTLNFSRMTGVVQRTTEALLRL
jgi:Zn-dependent M28 family amino/carboxypeptidase